MRANLSGLVSKLSCDGDIERQHFFKKKFIQKLKTSPIAIETDKANEQHYEVPTDFFKLVGEGKGLINLRFKLRLFIQ